MNVRVQCPCGTKFSFDVEPVNGRMPLNVNCPGCNQSALDLANAQIRLQSGVAVSPVHRRRLPPACPRPSRPTGQESHISRAMRPRPAPAVKAPAPPSPPSASVPAASVPQPSGAGSLRISKSRGAGASSAAPAAVPRQPHPLPAPMEAAAPEAGAHGMQSLCPRHRTEPATETCHVCGKPICEKCMEQFGYVCSVYCRVSRQTPRSSRFRCMSTRRRSGKGIRGWW